MGRVRARPGAACSTQPAGRSSTTTSSPIPAVRQDIAVAVPEEIPVGELVAAAREAAGEELREIHVFDVYRGDQVGPGKKSVAFSVAYQASDRTLAEEDATRLRDAIVAALAEKFGAELRA